MSKQSDLIPDETTRRKQRVAHMRKAIVGTIATWMLLSLIAIIVLCVQVIRLDGRITSIVQPETIADTQYVDVGKINYDKVVTGIDSIDNIATEGDIHYVYLTFNGSPSSNTEEILDILNTYQVKATFFVEGNEAEEYKPVYQRIVNEGHTLGMHSYSNQYSAVYQSTDAFLTDLNKLSSYLYDVTGVQSKYYRFLGGSGNEISDVNMVDFVKVLNQKEITYFDWNVSAGDATSDYTVADVVSQVTAGVANYKTSVVLLHDADNKSTTVEALGPLIEALEKMDAVILPIDENTNLIQYIHSDSVE